MSLIYSPYLGRYVRKLSPIKGSIYKVVPRRLISPLAANGNLVSYTFPTTEAVGENAPWSCDVHNTGTDGVIAFGLVNNTGSPGNIVVNWKGQDTTLEPGTYLRIYTVGSVPNCTHIIENGLVRFLVKGSYKILLWGMHQEGTTWYYDTEVSKTVVVDGAQPPPQEWLVEIPLKLFTGLILQASQWETGKGKDSYPFGVGDPEVFLGARIEYTITYLDGNTACQAGIDLNGENLVTENLGGPLYPKTATGNIDVSPDLIFEKGNKVRVGQNNIPSFWNKVQYTVKITLGYSETPKIKPGPEFQWPELEWWQWGLIGGVGILIIWTGLSSKGYAPSPTIIVTQPYEYLKERLEERKR